MILNVGCIGDDDGDDGRRRRTSKLIDGKAMRTTSERQLSKKPKYSNVKEDEGGTRRWNQNECVLRRRTEEEVG
jgi:hypothetical protein